MSREHIVKSYDEELEHLNNTIIQMGGLTEVQVDSAIHALVSRDPDLAYKIIDDDDKIDELNFRQPGHAPSRPAPADGDGSAQPPR